MDDLLHGLPEVIVSNAHSSVLISRSMKKGKLRKLASRLYTSNFDDSPESIVRRHLWQIVALFVPRGLVADRTALELKPTPDGSVFVVSNRKRDIKMPGITIRSRKGPAAFPEDKPFLSGLRLSSTARGYLENMRTSRPRGGADARVLPREALEEKLDSILRRSGETAIQKIRDDARLLAPMLGLQREFRQLDSLIGTLLGTRDSPVTSRAVIARRMGNAYDPARFQLFEALHRALQNAPPVTRLDLGQSKEALAFYEAYFSNFIEGTEFEVREAEEIVFEGKLPENRPADAHDILGTYRIVSRLREMKKVPRGFEEFTTLLKERHSMIMSARHEKSPGRFKATENRAGSTVFVSPELVEGTLRVGFELYRSLESPFQRAVFMTFLVAEVHPFEDGNGRLARVMMNSELVAGGEQRIIIPTVFRNNYISALKALSHNSQPDPLIRMLEFAQRYTSRVDWSDLVVSRRILEATNAFVDPAEADLHGIRLGMPDETLLADIAGSRK